MSGQRSGAQDNLTFALDMTRALAKIGGLGGCSGCSGWADNRWVGILGRNL